MRFAFFESLKIGTHFMYHFEEYVKINDDEGKKVWSGTEVVYPFEDNTVTFPL